MRRFLATGIYVYNLGGGFFVSEFGEIGPAASDFEKEGFVFQKPTSVSTASASQKNLPL